MSIHQHERLPAFTLSDLSGAPVPLARYRGRLSLALYLAGAGNQEWLAAVTGIEPELRVWGAETVLVVPAPAPEAGSLAGGLDFAGTVLLDEGSRLHQRLAAVDANGRPCPALVIFDRVGEVRFRLDPPSASEADLTEAIGWARYLGIQEPECGTCVPAWSPELMER